MIMSVKGRFKDGIVELLEPVAEREEQEVIVTFPDDEKAAPPVQETDYDALTKLIEECQMDTGITDLAHEHDHYLYGTPKRGDR